MEDRLCEYIETLFQSVPMTEKAFSVKAETLGRLTLLYHNYVSQGKLPEEAYGLAIASLGDVGLILQEARGAVSVDSGAEDVKARSAVLTAVAVILYILCPVPCILLRNIVGVVLLFVFVAAATGLLIFNGMTKKKTPYENDAAYEPAQNSAFKAVSTALWAVVIAVYFFVSFLTKAWYITWVLFLIGVALEGLLKAVFDLRGTKR